MAWDDLNDIIDELREVMDEIERDHPDLNTFKAPIARAIASLRADKASVEFGAKNARWHGIRIDAIDPAASKLPRHSSPGRDQYLKKIADRKLCEELNLVFE
nr:hypothetical protein [Candidatus Sigynarchaeota archaeon]